MKSVQIFRHDENVLDFAIVYSTTNKKNVEFEAWPGGVGDGDVIDKHGSALRKLLGNAYDKFVIFKQTPKVIKSTTTSKEELSLGVTEVVKNLSCLNNFTICKGIQYFLFEENVYELQSYLVSYKQAFVGA